MPRVRSHGRAGRRLVLHDPEITRGLALRLGLIDLYRHPSERLIWAAFTTLIVSLGIVMTPAQLVIVEVAVALLTLQAIVINRHAGIDYPAWALRGTEP